VCGLTVCAQCGNTQRQSGEKTAVHDACLDTYTDNGGFSMIKFVK
jgi:hypothetical protein